MTWIVYDRRFSEFAQNNTDGGLFIGRFKIPEIDLDNLDKTLSGNDHYHAADPEELIVFYGHLRRKF